MASVITVDRAGSFIQTVSSGNVALLVDRRDQPDPASHDELSAAVELRRLFPGIEQDQAV